MSGQADPLTGAADAVRIAAAVRAGEVSARDVAEAAIARVETEDADFNFLIAERFERALAEADLVDTSAPLAGVPILIKDYLATVEGMPQNEGSAYLRGWIAHHDSEYVARLRRAGVLVLGSSATSEMALQSTVENARFGVTRNPAAPGRTVGGSSGGAAAAVASGAVPVAHGSDAGGSIRIPAACCGLVGLKPSRGRNPLGPAHGDMAAGLWVEGVISRTVRDTAAFLDATHGPSTGDPYVAPAANGTFADAAAAPPRALRIAIATDTPGGVPSDPDCVGAVAATADLLSDLGHEVFAGEPRFDVAGAEEDFFALFCAGLAARVDLWTKRLGRAPVGDELEPYTWGLLEQGRAQSAAGLLGTIDRLQGHTRRIAAFYADIDLWLTPTLGLPAVPLGYFDIAAGESAQDALDRDAMFTAFLYLANLTGQPALSYPAGRTAGGVPVGVQLMGRYGDEATLLAIGTQLEQHLPPPGTSSPASLRLQERGTPHA